MDSHQEEPAIDRNRDLKTSELKVKLEKVDAKPLENHQLSGEPNDCVRSDETAKSKDNRPEPGRNEADISNGPDKLTNGEENGQNESDDQPDQPPPPTGQANGQAASPIQADLVDQQEIKQEEQPADAQENKENCEDYVNFAVICSFFQQFGAQIGVNYSIETLKEMLEGSSKKLEESLIELNIKLLRKTRKYVNRERWEQGLVKFLYESAQIADALELETTGYHKSTLRFKIDLLKSLLEAQFDFNQKFKTEINNIETLLLRLVPIGRDSNGNQYWYNLDEEHTLRIYREQPNADRDWKLICQNKDEFTQLIDDVEHEKTELCILDVTATDENTDNEEEKTAAKKKKKYIKKGKRRGKKGAKNKKLVNGHSKEDLSKDKDLEASDKPVVDSSAVLVVSIKKEAIDSKPVISVKQEGSRPIEEQPVKAERRSGRKPLNRSLFTAVGQKQSSSTESNSRVDENIEQIVQQTIRSLLDQIEQSGDHGSPIAPPSSIADASFADRNDEPQQEQPDETQAKGKRSRKKKNPLGELSRLLGDNAPANVEDLMPVKRSSRIQKLQEKKEAELKVQMELEQKRLEELNRMKDAKKKLFEQRSDSEPEEEEAAHVSDSDESFKEPVKSRKKPNRSSETEDETVSNKKKQKRSRKKDKEREKQLKKFKKNCSDDELFYGYEEDEEEEILVFDDKEDEFACEELEEDDEPVVLKRARTARKAKTEDNGELDECVNDDTPCQKCNLYTNPEWILLCDHCDLGYHTECLTPKLYLIPDGDWYCPKCENEQLLIKLRFEFENYVSNLAKREREQLRKERLKYVEINIGNILTEESTSRKNKGNKKKYEDYVSDLDDSELDDPDDEDDSSVDFDSDNSDTFNQRKSAASRRRSNNANGRRRPAVQPRKVSRPPAKRKRRRSYTDESGSNSSSNSNLSSQEDDQASNSSASSLPRQRSARKKVSYQFKEYDDLIDSAIRASDYEEDEYAENEEQEDEEEEDSDDGKSPYSKGKDIANLMSMATENPFASDNDEEKTKKADEPVLVNAAETEPSKEKPNDEPDADKDDERKVVVPEQKGKQKSKRKLNDLDSPIEEAENDSDFTIKDESLTELEEDTEMDEVESSDLSNATEDDTDLSDWARSTRRRSTRSGGSRHHKSKRSKKRRRFESSDESDYGYKTRRRAKRVTYKEASTTEDDLDDDYSDNSEKIDKKKKKDGKKKKKISTDDEFSDGQIGSEDERTVLKKSKRTQKKKVYDDFTDLDESEEELQQELNNEAEGEEETKDQQIPTAKEELANESRVEGLPKVEITQVELPNEVQQAPAEATAAAPTKKASKVKIKITKPNPKLAKNKKLDANSVEQQAVPPQVDSLAVASSDAQNTALLNNGNPLAIAQLENSSQLPNPMEPNLSSDVAPKKKRNRAPKNPPKETVNNPSTLVVPAAPAKRSRKSKSSAGQEPVDVNATNLIPPAALNSLNSSVLSQLTQFANDPKLDPINSKLLPNAPFAGALDPANFKQFLNSAVPNAQQLNDLTIKHLPLSSELLKRSQSELIARQATLASSKPDKKSPKESKSSKRSKQSADKTAAAPPIGAPQTVPKTAASLPVSTSSSKLTANSTTNSAMSHILPNVSLNHPQIPHFPTPQSLHGSNPNIGRQMPPSSHPIPNHLNPALLGAHPGPPPNAMPPNYPTHHLPPSHQIPPHGLHNPYYPPPATHSQPTPNQLAAAAAAQHHPGLPPQLSHLANHPQFSNQIASRFQNGPPNPLAGYPFPPYPDAAFAYYHHQMNNAYYNYPNQPHHHPAYSLPGQHHPSQIAPPVPNLAPPHSQPLPNSLPAATSVHTSHSSSTSQTNPKTTSS